MGNFEIVDKSSPMGTVSARVVCERVYEYMVSAAVFQMCVPHKTHKT